MEMFQNFSTRRCASGIEPLLNFTPLSQPQKSHLSKVYGLLVCGIPVTILGVWFQTTQIAIPQLISLLGLIGFFIAIKATSPSFDSNKDLDKTRFMYYCAFTFLLGSGIGDYVFLINMAYPGVLLNATIGTAAIFACMSGTAVFAKQRSYLYLGGILSSALSYMLLVNLANVFFRSRLADDIVLYCSLFLFMGYVVYDTQVALEDYANGNRDYLLHAINLYVDMIDIFVRLVRILKKKEESKRERR